MVPAEWLALFAVEKKSAPESLAILNMNRYPTRYWLTKALMSEICPFLPFAAIVSVATTVHLRANP